MEETTVKPNPPATTAAPKKKVQPKKKAAPKPAAEKAPAATLAIKAPEKETGDPTEKTRKTLAAEKKVTVVINSTAEDKDDVFVAVNGYPYTIQRDKEVQIPFSVYQTLMDARSTVYRQVKREDGEGMQMVETEVQRFSMSARF